MITDAMKDVGWIDHDGGECPVDCPPSGIYVILRCGIMGWVTEHALAWSQEPMGDGITRRNLTDIIAYRPEPKP